MTRRLLPAAVALGLGFVALMLLLLGLGRIFRDEAREARSELAARREALSQYATTVLAQRLGERLQAASLTIDRAAKDPLLDAGGLLLAVDRERLLPVLPPGGTRAHASGEVLSALLEGGAGSLVDDAPDSPAAERYRLVGQLHQALRKNSRDEVVAAVRRFLGHRAAFTLPTSTDAAATLAVALLLERQSTPDPSLLRGLLRDGFPGTTGQDGVQRLVLKRKPRLGAGEFKELCELVAVTSREVGVEVDDFDRGCAQSEPAAGALPPFAGADDGEWLYASSLAQWYLQSRGQEVRGVKVDLSGALLELSSQMRGQGLLGDGDAVERVGAAGDALEPIFGLRLEVSSPLWPRAEARIAERLRLKTGLLVVCGVSGLAIVLLALLAQRRKLRFVELKSDFVSAVSHELKTPLASVRLMAETLERKLQGAEGAKDYPRRIVSEIDGLSALVENILSFNRLDKGRWVARQQDFALQSLVEVLRDDAEASTVPVELAFEGFEGHRLEADPELMKLLFLNLLRNACRYNQRTPVQVSFSAAVEGSHLVVRVTDNGVGIPSGEWERVFDEFFRLKGQPGRGGGGSGLGLALCRRIMALHGGTVRVDRSDQSGTTFALRF